MLRSQRQLRELLKPHIAETMKPIGMGYINRQEFLRHHGWTATTPTVEWMQSYGSKDEWNKFLLGKQLKAVNWVTLGLERDPGASSFYDRGIMGNMKEVIHKNDKRWLGERDFVVRETRLFYEKEKVSKLKGYCDHVDPKKKTSPVTLYNRVMKAELKSMGFGKSKDFSSSNVAVYSKSISKNWNIAFFVDKSTLRIPYESKFYCRISYGLVHSSHRGDWPKQEYPFMLFTNELFYPIGLTTAMLVYEEGQTLSDLELFLLAQIDMYSGIQDEFEAALISLLPHIEDFN